MGFEMSFLFKDYFSNDSTYLFLVAKALLESIDLTEIVLFFISYSTAEVKKKSHILLPTKTSNIRVPWQMYLPAMFSMRQCCFFLLCPPGVKKSKSK